MSYLGTGEKALKGKNSVWKACIMFWLAEKKSLQHSLQCFSNTFSEFQICHCSPGILVCFVLSCKWWSEKWCTYVGKKLLNLSFERANLYFDIFVDVHLHSYCRLFLPSWVYKTHFSEICPHSCVSASHVIHRPVSSGLKFWNRRSGGKKHLLLTLA